MLYSVALLLEQLIPVMHLDAEAIADLLNTLPEKVALLEGLEALMKQPGLSNLLSKKPLSPTKLFV